MFETSKSVLRRTYDQRFVSRYFVGCGIDIGAGSDSIGNYRAIFPLMTSVKAWDMEDGDAMLMDGVADGSYDFVHSSHCLEHMVDPILAMQNWVRLCKPGGHLIMDVLEMVLDDVAVLRIEVLDIGYDYNLPRTDQTQFLCGESAIEIVLRKYK